MKVPVSEIVSCNIVRMIIMERKKEIYKRVKNRRKRERERKVEEETRE